MGRGYSRRPLLRGPDPLEALRRLYAERDALYAAADHVFDTERFYQQQLTSVIASLADLSEEA
jgi:shikimate kinase